MPASDLDLLIEAANEAGEIASGYYTADPQVWHKPDDAGPVTEADYAVDHMLREKLRSARPDYGWLSEETEDSAERLSTKHQFIIDPIDGTRAFINGSRDWAHSIAIATDGKITAAVVFLPIRNQMYAAGRGTGAFLNGERLSIRDRAGIPSVLAAKPNWQSKFWKNGTPPECDQHFRSSLAYRMCLVGVGRFDAMLTLRPSWEWDIAAGSLIIEEAGGIVTDRAGDPLVFNNPFPQVDGVVAGTNAAHSLLRENLA